MDNPAAKLAFAIDGLIRSRVSGHGGEEFARKCIREIAEAIDSFVEQQQTQVEHETMLHINFPKRQAYGECTCGWITKTENFVLHRDCPDLDLSAHLHIITYELGKELGEHESKASPS